MLAITVQPKKWSNAIYVTLNLISLLAQESVVLSQIACSCNCNPDKCKMKKSFPNERQQFKITSTMAPARLAHEN